MGYVIDDSPDPSAPLPVADWTAKYGDPSTGQMPTGQPKGYVIDDSPIQENTVDPSNIFEGMKNLPSGLWNQIKSIPSGIDNLNEVASAPMKFLSGQDVDLSKIENALRGTGTIASGIAGGGTGAAAGAGLGAYLAPLTGGLSIPAGAVIGGALGGGAGLLGFNKLNQITGSDAPTTGAQDINSFLYNTGQGLAGGAVSEAIPRIANPTINAAELGISDLIGPQTPEAASRIVKDNIGKYVDSSKLEESLKSIKTDPLSGLQTSAEALQSPELAILEQKLGSSDKALEYAKYQNDTRASGRNFIKDQISAATDLPTENTGAAIQDLYNTAKDNSKASVSALYDAIPSDVTAPVYPLKMAIQDAKNQYFGPGSPPVPLRLQGVIDYITNPKNENNLSIGELQRLRSHTGDIANVAYRTGENETGALASTINKSIKSTLENAPVGAKEWTAANDAYREHALTFKDGPIVNIGDAKKILPSQVITKILSSPESAQKFTDLFDNQPKAVQLVKDQLMSDFSGLSDTRKAGFINANESQLKSLLGKDFTYLDAIRNDIKSKTSAQGLANATRGSNTALKLSDSIQKALTGKDVTAKPGLWDRTIQGMGLGSGGALGYSHPAVAIPTAIGAYAIKALKDKGNTLIQNSLYDSLMNPEVLKNTMNLEPSTSFKIPNIDPIIVQGALTQKEGEKSTPQSGNFIDNALNRAQDKINSTSVTPTSPQGVDYTDLYKTFKADTSPQSGSFIDNAMNRAESKMNGTPLAPPTIIDAKRIDHTDPEQIAAVMPSLWHQESGGNSDAVSTAGAKGVGQLMDATGKELFNTYKDTLPDGINKKYDPFNTDQNKALSTLYMKEMLQKYDGDLALSLTAYNQGPKRIDDLLKIHNANSLSEIRQYLGPDGKAYAKSIMSRLTKQGVLKV